MYPFTVSTACLIFFVTCTISHEVEPTKDYVYAEKNLSNKPANEWISRRSSFANNASPRKNSYRSKTRLSSVVLFLNANVTRSTGTSNNFSHIEALLASYEDTSEEDDGCQNDRRCQDFLKNSVCLKEATNRTRCVCPYGHYIDTSKEILECAKRVSIGSICQQSAQCVESSVCRRGICVCQERYVFDGFKCIRDKRYECNDNYECQQYLKQSVCDVKNNGSKCRCLPDYIHYDYSRECLEKVSLGDRCKSTMQCPANSFCTSYACVCKSGYVRKGNQCVVNSPVLRTPNFLLALIAGVICLIVVSCLFVTFLSIRRKIRNALRQASPDHIPSISSQIDAREPFSPDPYERIDKPPSYEEAMSSSTSVLTLSTEDINPAPPTYSQVQEQHRNVNSMNTT